MTSVNKAIIIGRLGKDPEIKYLPSGEAVTNLSVATETRWKDSKTKENKSRTEWHRVVIFGRQAEVAGEYLKKGSLVYLSGEIQTRSWKDKQGNERYTTEINAREMQMLGSKDRDESKTRGPAEAQSDANSGADDFDDDIPF